MAGFLSGGGGLGLRSRRLSAIYQYNNGIETALYRHGARSRMKTKRQTTFNPIFTITAAMAANLMRIEAVRQAIQSLPITPRVLASLRERARLFSTHGATMIEAT